MSLFFINRPIKQERPPSMFYFVQAPFPRFRSRFFRISFSLSYRPAFASLFRVLSFSSLAVANLHARVLVLLGFSLSLSRFPGTNFLVARRRTPFFDRARSNSFFLLFYSTFSRANRRERERKREESFYYLGARLQCLADNKPMKATFEPEGPLKSPFSPTSRVFFVSPSLSLSLFKLSFLSHMLPFLFLFPSVVDPVPFLRRCENFALLFLLLAPALCVLIFTTPIRCMPRVLVCFEKYLQCKTL